MWNALHVLHVWWVLKQKVWVQKFVRCYHVKVEFVARMVERCSSKRATNSRPKKNDQMKKRRENWMNCGRVKHVEQICKKKIGKRVDRARDVVDGWMRGEMMVTQRAQASIRARSLYAKIKLVEYKQPLISKEFIVLHVPSAKKVCVEHKCASRYTMVKAMWKLCVCCAIFAQSSEM